MSFYKDGYICLVPRDNNESKEHHISRGYFVVSQMPTNKKEYYEAVKYSRIYNNVKYLKCTYSDIIMDKLNKMINNMFVED
jgi:hypothetical protein